MHNATLLKFISCLAVSIKNELVSLYSIQQYSKFTFAIIQELLKVLSNFLGLLSFVAPCCPSAVSFEAPPQVKQRSGSTTSVIRKKTCLLG